MKGTNFNTAISILFVGYILGQVPSNLVLTRVRPSLYIPGFACLWGAVSACTAAADSYPHLVVIRFFLGITEAPFFPGILFFLSSWYTKKELALRVSIVSRARRPSVVDCLLRAQFVLGPLTTALHWRTPLWRIRRPYCRGYPEQPGRQAGPRVVALAVPHRGRDHRLLRARRGVHPPRLPHHVSSQSIH